MFGVVIGLCLSLVQLRTQGQEAVQDLQPLRHVLAEDGRLVLSLERTAMRLWLKLVLDFVVGHLRRGLCDEGWPEVPVEQKDESVKLALGVDARTLDDLTQVGQLAGW